MEFIHLIKTEKKIALSLPIDSDEILLIGQKINDINDDAYMNGYNCDIFVQHYLGQKAPELLEGLDFDSEAGLFCAYYSNTPENEEKANKLKALLEKLIDNENLLYDYITKFGDDIEWD